jgi:DNA primase
VVDDLPSLLWVVNLGSIELHAFPTAADRLDEPAYVVFDLDPGPGTGLAECCRIALWLCEALDDVGLQGVCKSSGGLGIHVYVPLALGHSFDESRRLPARSPSASPASGRISSPQGARSQAVRDASLSTGSPTARAR